MAEDAQKLLRAYIDYYRDLGVHDFYRRGEAGTGAWPETAAAVEDAKVNSVKVESTKVESSRVPVAVTEVVDRNPKYFDELAQPPANDEILAEIPGVPLKLVSFNDLAPVPETTMPVELRADALRVVQEDIGDCTRCPLAYAGRRKIVFADGSPSARLMFVGEGPGADEDTTGIPFVGKAGQLLNNMIAAMGLKREEVYIANIVKCRPPANRAPEPEEANTCTQFLLRQMDIVQPQVVVALGATAATYLMGIRKPLSTVRGRWHRCRRSKLAVTYHPAFLLRDPRMKGEAWKDLQMVMAELGLKAPAKSK